VNQLAGNLTSQLRAIADVATAGNEGRPDPIDSSRSPGEVAFVKDNINEMIRNLRGHDISQQRTGLVEDEPASSAECCKGNATCSRWLE